jgi:outer membrane protein OmpA-like peptidoglycan-associated protein
MRPCSPIIAGASCTALLALACLAGCAGPNAQIASCQTEKQELLAVIEQEKNRSKAFEERALALESRLDQSEKQLAQLVRPGTRFGSDAEPRTASKAVRQLDAPSRSEKPIREPKAIDGSPGSGSQGNSRSSLLEMKLQAPARGSDQPESRLAALAERDTRLDYNPELGTARFKIDVPFETNAATLTAQGRQRLDEVAAWLKSSQTSDLRVIVAGNSTGMTKPPAGADAPRFANDRQLAAARAMAVADYLDRHGIKEDRLAVVGSGSKSSTSSTVGSVEILLSEPETTVAGIWQAGRIRR